MTWTAISSFCEAENACGAFARKSKTWPVFKKAITREKDTSRPPGETCFGIK
jgi:hypothetical protein